MTNELILAKVKTKVWNKAPHLKQYQYLMSNGTKLVTPKDLVFKKWYFVEIAVNPLTRGRTYVSHAALTDSDVESYQKILCEMKRTSFEVNKIWKQLNAKERQIVMRGFGLAAGTGATGSFLLNGIGQFVAEEATIGWLTGGLSLAVSLGFAGFTYLQYEEMKEALKQQSAIMHRYIVVHNTFTRSLMRFTPPQYDHLRIADPEFEGIVSRLKSVISNISVENLTKILPSEMKFAGVAA